jgi:alpha-galactosidase/6-phospho-beta-glucosidase family protein
VVQRRGPLSAALGGDRTFNPLGYTYNTLPATIDYRGDMPNFNLPSALANNLANPAAYGSRPPRRKTITVRIPT